MIGVTTGVTTNAHNQIGCRIVFIIAIYRQSKGELRYELLNREIFHGLWEAKVLVERCRKEYNLFKPKSFLGYRPPAPEALEPILRAYAVWVSEFYISRG